MLLLCYRCSSLFLSHLRMITKKKSSFRASKQNRFVKDFILSILPLLFVFLRLLMLIIIIVTDESNTEQSCYGQLDKVFWKPMIMDFKGSKRKLKLRNCTLLTMNCARKSRFSISNTSIHVHLRIGFFSVSTTSLLDNRAILWTIHKTFLIYFYYILR